MRGFKFIYRSVLVIISLTLIVLTLIFLSISLPFSRQFLIHKAENYFLTKYDITFSLADFKLEYHPLGLCLDSLSIPMKNEKYNILSLEYLKTSFSLSKLIHEKQIHFFQLRLKNANVNLRTKEGQFNFDYILNEFSNSSEQPKTSSKSLPISCDSIALENIAFDFIDENDSSFIKLKTSYLGLQDLLISVDEQAYKVDSVSIKGVLVEQDLGKKNEKEEPVKAKEAVSETGDLPKIRINNLEFVDLTYSQLENNDTVSMKVAAKYLALANGHLDLNSDLVDIRTLEILKPEIRIRNSQEKESFKAVKKTELADNNYFKPSEFAWSFKLDSLEIRQGVFCFFEEKEEVENTEVEPSDLDFREINVRLKNIGVFPSNYKFQLEKLNFQEKSNFKLSNLSFYFSLEKNELTIDNLDLELKNSRLKQNLGLRFHSLDSLFSSDYHTVLRNTDSLRLELLSSSFFIKDIETFLPASKAPYLDSLRAKKLDFQIDLTANKQEINLSLLKFRLGESLDLALHSNLNRALSSDLKKNKGSVFIDFLVLKDGIYMPFLDSSIVSQYNFPENFRLEGELKSDSVMHSILSFESDIGNIWFKGSYDSLNRINSAIELCEIDLKDILKKEEFGELSLKLACKAEGFPSDKLSKYSFVLSIDSLEYKDYVYEKVHLISSGLYDSLNYILYSKDRNLDFYCDGTLHNFYKSPEIYLKSDINNINFRQIHLTEDSLKMKTNFTLSLKGNRLDSLISDFHIKNLVLERNRFQEFSLDYFRLSFRSLENRLSLKVDSDILKVDLDSQESLKNSLSSLLSFQKYYFYSTEREENIDLVNTKISASLDLDINPLLSSGFVTALDSVSKISLRSDLDGRRNKAYLDLEIPKLAKSAYSIDSTVVYMKADTENLEYSMNSKGVYVEDSLAMGSFGVRGAISKDTLDYHLFVNNQYGENRFLLSGNYTEEQDKLRFNLTGEQKINGVIWTSIDSNFFEIEKGHFRFHNFGLSNDSSSVLFHTNILAQGDTVNELSLKNIHLENITDISDDGNWIFAGELNVYLSKSSDNYYGDINLKDFGILRHRLASINLQFNPGTLPKSIEGDLNVDGSIGTVHSNFDMSKDFLDLNLNFRKLYLKPFSFLAKEYLSKLEGKLRGKVHLSKSKSQFNLNGNLDLEKVKVKAKLLNSEFHLDSTKFILQKSSLFLPQVVLKDSLDNTAIIRGNIKLVKPETPIFDLNIALDKFILMDMKKELANDYYGKIVLTNNTNIKGSLSKLNLTTTLNILKETELNYINSSSAFSDINTGAGVVIFTNYRKKKGKHNPLDSVLPRYLDLDLNANVSVEKGSKFRIELDPSTESIVQIEGEGDLAIDYKTEEDILVNGQYKLEGESSYGMKFYKIIPRKFNAKEGSLVIWTGNPLNPNLDLTAVYRVRTSPYNLMLIESNLSADELKKYRKSQLFDLYINIKGTLENPELSFEIDFPEAIGNTSTGEINDALSRLNSNENELNKQAFSLIIIQSFVSGNSASFDPSSGILESLSGMISNRLNKISSKYLKGLDLNVDVNTYNQENEQGGVQTQTNVGLSIKQSLFNKRLTIKLGGTVSVGSNDQNTSDFVGDVELEYLLTPDGRYIIKGFRKIDDGKIFNPSVIKTGFDFVFKKVFNLNH